MVNVGGNRMSYSLKLRKNCSPAGFASLKCVKKAQGDGIRRGVAEQVYSLLDSWHDMGYESAW